MSEQSRCQIAFVSGRGLSDLQGVIGLDDCIYAGSHGHEIAGDGLAYKHEVPHHHALIVADVKHDLISKLGDIKGAHLEDKGICLSLHYRLCSAPDKERLKEYFRKNISPYEEENAVRVSFGKELLEVMPVTDWNKGKAVCWILKNRPAATFGGKALAIYIGDDHTDESAFEKLRDCGITVHVGRGKKSRARYFVNDVGEVYEFLKYVHACLQCSGAHAGPKIRLVGKGKSY